MAKKYYAVAKGRETGIFEDWPTVQKLVHKFPGPRFKGFETLQEAENWLQTQLPPDLDPGGTVIYVDGSCLADGSEASYGYVIAEENSQGNIASIYKGAFGRVSRDLVPESLDYDEIISQRNIVGELFAVVHSVMALPESAWDKDRPVKVYHDLVHSGMWATGAWELKNPLSVWYHRFLAPYMTMLRFVHVKGHSGNIGNEMVDQLAALALGRSIRISI